MSLNLEYIAVVLDDYCDMQTSGFIPTANRYPVADVQEQVELLEHLQPVANEVLARRIAELERQLSEQTALVFDLTAERDNAWQELREIREAIGANPEESTADEVRRVTSERDKALAQAEQLKGIKPQTPPRPPFGGGLPRYGINWNGPEQPLTVPMDDGYWTPYHLALAQNAELVAQVENLRYVARELSGCIDEYEGLEEKSVRNAMFDFNRRLQLRISTKPAQHLRDIQAEALLSAVEFFKPSRDIDVEALASYAERVRAGE